MSVGDSSKVSNDYPRLWTDQILKELELWAARFVLEPDATLRTIYFGGGTPSLLKPEHLEQIVERIRSLWPCEIEELCLEANPESVTEETVDAWKSIGFSRVSLGVQTFQPALLRRLERLATHDDLERALELVQRAFSNWSLDLMIAIPDQTLEDLENDLERLRQVSSPHLSIYLLTLAVDHIWNRSPTMSKKIPPEALAEAMYQRVCRYAAENRYQHYEISNFARPGMQSVHNRNYWDTNSSYLGLGPGAHGYLRSTQGDRIRTIEALHAGDWLKGLEPEAEWLTGEQQDLESFYMTLRLNRGLVVTPAIALKAKALVLEGLVVIREEKLYLTQRAWLCMESIAAALLT